MLLWHRNGQGQCGAQMERAGEGRLQDPAEGRLGPGVGRHRRQVRSADVAAPRRHAPAECETVGTRLR